MSFEKDQEMSIKLKTIHEEYLKEPVKDQERKTSFSGSSSDREVSYQIIVKDDKKPFPQVYAGRCCKSSISSFVGCTERPKKEKRETQEPDRLIEKDSRGCGGSCVIG